MYLTALFGDIYIYICAGSYWILHFIEDLNVRPHSGTTLSHTFFLNLFLDTYWIAAINCFLLPRTAEGRGLINWLYIYIYSRDIDVCAKDLFICQFLMHQVVSTFQCFYVAKQITIRIWPMFISFTLMLVAVVCSIVCKVFQFPKCQDLHCMWEYLYWKYWNIINWWRNIKMCTCMQQEKFWW